MSLFWLVALAALVLGDVYPGLCGSRPSSEPCADAAAADVEVAGDGGEARLVASQAGGLVLYCPLSGEGVVVEGIWRPAALAETAPGGEGARPGFVVDFTGGAELAEALADGGF